MSYNLQTPSLPYFSELSKMSGYGQFYPFELHTLFPSAHVLECSLEPLQLPIFFFKLDFLQEVTSSPVRKPRCYCCWNIKRIFQTSCPCHMHVSMSCSCFLEKYSCEDSKKLLEKWGRSGFFTEVTFEIFILRLFILTISCLLSNLPLIISNVEVN